MSTEPAGSEKITEDLKKVAADTVLEFASKFPKQIENMRMQVTTLPIMLTAVNSVGKLKEFSPETFYSIKGKFREYLFELQRSLPELEKLLAEME